MRFRRKLCSAIVYIHGAELRWGRNGQELFMLLHVRLVYGAYNCHMRQRQYRVWVLLRRLCRHVFEFGLWKLREFFRNLLVECFKLRRPSKGRLLQRFRTCHSRAEGGIKLDAKRSKRSVLYTRPEHRNLVLGQVLAYDCHRVRFRSCHFVGNQLPHLVVIDSLDAERAGGEGRHVDESADIGAVRGRRNCVRQLQAE